MSKTEEKPAHDDKPTLDEAIQSFRNWAEGGDGMDELDLKEYLYDVWLPHDKHIKLENGHICSECFGNQDNQDELREHLKNIDKMIVARTIREPIPDSSFVVDLRLKLTDAVVDEILAHTQKAVDNARDIIKMADEYTFADGTKVYGAKKVEQRERAARIDEIHRYGWELYDKSYPTYAKERIAQLKKGTE